MSLAMAFPTTRGLRQALISLIVLALGLGSGVWWLNVRDDGVATDTAATPSSNPSTLAQRGAYLARAGNCEGCHTAPGGVAYAGGRGVPTPFGTVYASNLTPDAVHGLGGWSAEQFWRALHNGRSRDGRLLYPAFPYPNFTRITRADSDALFAYLGSLPAIAQANRAHELRFPFNLQVTLALWRALYFRPAQTPHDATRSEQWNRGAYLVEALGHCNACHASRNALGASASTLDLAGGLIPVQNWYAPSLTSLDEAGVSDADSAIRLLRDGVCADAAVSGPMSEVVAGSTQYLLPDDLQSMAVYLQTLAVGSPKRAQPAREAASTLAGSKLYEDHCAGCHGIDGEGVRGVYPPLAGSRTVTLQTPANLVHVVHEGGFPPVTAGNPRPFGMPPFATVLNDDDVAQVLTWIRQNWGNRASAVTALDVRRYAGKR